MRKRYCIIDKYQVVCVDNYSLDGSETIFYVSGFVNLHDFAMELRDSQNYIHYDGLYYLVTSSKYEKDGVELTAHRVDKTWESEV